MDESFVLQATYSNYNYGSVLQCYATQRYFEAHGVKCYLIKRTYSPFERFYKALTRRVGYTIKIHVYPNYKEEKERQQRSTESSITSISDLSKQSIDLFIQNNLKRLVTNQKNLKKIAEQKECLYAVCGSDQIWNASRIYIDDLYFLTFAPDSKKVAIAPSFGVDNIPTYNVSKYKKYISRFNKLSAREYSGKSIIKMLTGRDATHILDPVFLIEKYQWEQLADLSSFIPVGKYCFVFFLDEPSKKAIEAINRCKNEGFPIFTIAYNHKCYENIGCTIFEGGPQDFLAMIYHSERILTDSFHVTAFSTIFHKGFSVFERDYKGGNQSQRITELLLLVDLAYRYDDLNVSKLSKREIDKIDEVIKHNEVTARRYLFKIDNQDGFI